MKDTIKIVGMSHYEGKAPKLGEEITIKAKTEFPFKGTLQAVNKDGEVFGVIANSKEKIDKNEEEFIYSASELKEFKYENMTIRVMGGKNNWLYAKVVSTETKETGDNMIDDLFVRSLEEGFEEAWELYNDVYKTAKPDCLAEKSKFLLAVGDLIARQYLKDQCGRGKFDHSRVWYEMPVYTLLHYLDKNVQQEDVFTKASLLASKKFLLEEEINDFFLQEGE